MKKSLSVSEPVTAEYDGAVPLSPLFLKTTLWMETILSSFYTVLQKLACPRAHSPHRLRQDSSPVSKVPGPKCLTLNSSLPSKHTASPELPETRQLHKHIPGGKEEKRKRGGGREGGARDGERGGGSRHAKNRLQMYKRTYFKEQKDVPHNMALDGLGSYCKLCIFIDFILELLLLYDNTRLSFFFFPMFLGLTCFLLFF